LLASWALKTQTSYNAHLKKWFSYCKSRNIKNPYDASFKEAAEFLSYLFYQEQQKHGVIAATRSALSAILPLREGKMFGNDPTVQKILKGIFKLRLTLAKYTVTYNQSYIDSLPPNSILLISGIYQIAC